MRKSPVSQPRPRNSNRTPNVLIRRHVARFFDSDGNRVHVGKVQGIDFSRTERIAQGIVDNHPEVESFKILSVESR